MSNVIDLFTGQPVQQVADDSAKVQRFIDRHLTHLEVLLGELAEATTEDEFWDTVVNIRQAVVRWRRPAKPKETPMPDE